MSSWGKTRVAVALLCVILHTVFDDPTPARFVRALPSRGSPNTELRLQSSTRPTRILFFGDSFTSCNGVSSDFKFAHLSYRRWLWNLLKDRSVDVCFQAVGPRSGCKKQVDFHMANITSRFPQEHDAFFGRRLSEVLARDELSSSVCHSGANVVVLGLGLNDLYYATTASQIVEQFQQLMRGVFARCGSHLRRVFLLSLTPIVIKTATLTKLRRTSYVGNSSVEVNRLLMSEVFATRYGSNSSSSEFRRRGPPRQEGEGDRDAHVVTVVDIHSGFNPALFTYDGLHPNSLGEQHIGRRVAEHLFKFLATVPCGPKSTETPSDEGAATDLEHSSTTASSNAPTIAATVRSDSSPLKEVAASKPVDDVVAFAFILSVLVVVFVVCRPRAVRS